MTKRSINEHLARAEALGDDLRAGLMQGAGNTPLRYSVGGNFSRVVTQMVTPKNKKPAKPLSARVLG
jgi:hypothetical protein